MYSKNSKVHSENCRPIHHFEHATNNDSKCQDNDFAVKASLLHLDAFKCQKDTTNSVNKVKHLFLKFKDG